MKIAVAFRKYKVTQKILESILFIFSKFMNPIYKNELLQEAELLLSRRPRNNDEIIPVLSRLIEHEPHNWMANVELSESYHQKAEWEKCLIYATKANEIRKGSARAQILMVRSYIALELPKNALPLMHNLFAAGKRASEQLRQTDMASDDGSVLYSLFELLARSKVIWANKAQHVFLFRDLLINYKSQIGFNQDVQNNIGNIEPTSSLSVVETVRFLQLTSIVVGNSSNLLLWLNNNIMSMSPEESFIAYQLTAKLGDFPERFKPFLDGQDEIAEKFLGATINKICAAGPLPSRMRSTQSSNHKYLFFLAHMPDEDWFLRVGAHFKVVVDYARYLTEVDHAAEITILISNELSESSQHSYFGRWPFISDSVKYSRAFLEHYPSYDLSRIKFVCVKHNLADTQNNYFVSALQLINDLEPDIIIWFGGVLESVIFPRILGKQYPSIYRQFNVGNRPRGHFDVGMTYSENTAERLGGNWIKFDVAYSDLPTISEVPSEISELLRDGTILLTAGNNLIMRVDDNFISCAIDLLDKNSGTKWVFVGIKDVKAFRTRYSMLERHIREGKVILCGFVDYLGKLLDHADIFVYPKQGGGLGGMALAAMRGIPILCFQGGDADALLQKEDMAISYLDYPARLDQLVNDVGYRQMLGNRYKAVFGKEKYLSEARRLIDAGEAALVYYKDRKEKEAPKLSASYSVEEQTHR